MNCQMSHSHGLAKLGLEIGTSAPTLEQPPGHHALALNLGDWGMEGAAGPKVGWPSALSPAPSYFRIAVI